MSLEEPRPRYQQVADQIRLRVQRHEYEPGEKLPSQPKLAEEFGLTQTSVGKAIAILRAEGIIRVRDGVGAFVNEIPPINRNANARYAKTAREQGQSRGAFATELASLGLTPRSDVTVEVTTPPPAIADIFGLPQGEPNVVRRMRLMYANDVPVQIAPGYIPRDIAEGTQLAEVDSGPGGIISRFAELGYEQVKVTESVTVRSPDDDEQRFLNISADQRVYEVTHTGWTAKDQPVEVTVHVMPTYQWILHYEWPLT